MNSEPTERKQQSGATYIARDKLEQAGQAALEQRRAKGEIMTYVLDGWVVRESPGEPVVRLTPVADFRAEDLPLYP